LQREPTLRTPQELSHADDSRNAVPFWVLDVAAALLSVRRERRQIPRAAETCAVVDVDGQLAVRRDSDK
jgi:hypothetical protein